MRLSELNEEEVKKAVFTFGRLNPPHFGHGGMIDTLQKVAREQNANWFLFVSSKTGDEKNPLTYEQKVWWIQTLFPETKGHLIVDPTIKTPLVAATWLYKQGYRSATFVAGEDDMSSYGEMIKSGNAHGMKNPDAVRAGRGFVFNPLDFAISPRLASATNARKNVTDGDAESFVRSILGPKINPKLAALVHDQLYPTLRKAMGLGESVEEASRKSSWEKMSAPFKGTSKDLDKSDERAQQHIKGLKQAADDYQAIIDKEKKKAEESKLLNKRTPNVSQLAKKYMTNDDEIHRRLAKGIKVEYEHSSDIDVATEIAMDHLSERLDYYEQLAKAERAPKKKITDDLEETLKKVKGKWALVSRQDPGKVLQYYKGSGHPSKEWVNKVERRVHSFESEMDEDYRDAARYAAQAHAGQQRSGGKPYISHPVRVANLVKKYKDSAELDKLLSAAFLHDTIEDTDTTEEQLRKMFGDLVASLVKELTSDKEKIEKLGKAEYLTQKMINMSSWGLVIKLADRLDNVADIKTAKTPEWRHRYRAETESILSKLEQNRKLSGTHKNIIADIRAKLAELDEAAVSEEATDDVKPRVYLDMDGVLADFFGEWSRISDVDHYKDIDDVEAKLQLVRDHPTFWVDLPLLPHAKALIKTVIDQFGEYRICSKPLEGDARSKPGKLQWIQTHLSDMPPAEIILTADKADYATQDGAASILVDDFGKNVNAWRAAGGIGIKYEDSNFAQVAKILTMIAKSGVSK